MKFDPRPFTKRLWFMWWLQKQAGLRCALQGKLPAMTLPKNQECVVLSLAVLLPRWETRMVPVWVCSLGPVSRGWAGQSKLLGVMSLCLPSLQLHLLRKSSACSSPCPTFCQRLNKACLIFLTLMKTCINKSTFPV